MRARATTCTALLLATAAPAVTAAQTFSFEDPENAEPPPAAAPEAPGGGETFSFSDPENTETDPAPAPATPFLPRTIRKHFGNL